MKNHVNVNQSIIFEKIEELNSALKKEEIQLAKKKSKVVRVPYPFLCYKRTFQERWFVAKLTFGGSWIFN